MSDFDAVSKMANGMLADEEAMAHPIIGPTMRQLARIFRAKLKSMEIEQSVSAAVGSGGLTPDEARELCESGRALCIECAGAYGALARLLPEVARMNRGADT